MVSFEWTASMALWHWKGQRCTFSQSCGFPKAFFPSYCRCQRHTPSPPPPPPKEHVVVYYTNLTTGQWTINLTITLITSVLYKISLTLLWFAEHAQGSPGAAHPRPALSHQRQGPAGSVTRGQASPPQAARPSAQEAQQRKGHCSKVMRSAVWRSHSLKSIDKTWPHWVPSEFSASHEKLYDVG